MVRVGCRIIVDYKHDSIVFYEVFNQGCLELPFVICTSSAFTLRAHEGPLS